MSSHVRAAQHPLVQLAYRVRQQEISLAEAFAEAKTVAAGTTLDEESFQVLEVEVAQLTLHDPQLAYLLAHLKLTFVLHINRPIGSAAKPFFRVRGRCLLQAGHLSIWIGEIEYGQRLLQRALAHALYEDRRCEVDIYLGLAQASRLLAQADAAARSYEQALTLLRAIGDQERVCHVLHEIGVMQLSEGRHEAALRSYEQALATAQAVEDRRGAGYALQGRGEVQTAQGHYEAALQTYEQALATARTVRDQRLEAHCLLRIGYAQSLHGQDEAALRTWRQALPLFEALSDRQSLVDLHLYRGWVWQRRRHVAQAYEAYRQGLEHLEAIRGSLPRRALRRTLLAQRAVLYTLMVQVCLELDRPDEAWYWAERSKGRLLLDLLGSARPGLETWWQEAVYDDWQAVEHQRQALEQELQTLNCTGTDEPRATQPPVSTTSPPDPAHACAQEAFPSPESIAACDPQFRLSQLRDEAAVLQNIVVEMLDWERELIQVDIPLPEPSVHSLRALTRQSSREGQPPDRPLVVEYFLLGGDQYIVFLVPVWEEGSEGQSRSVAAHPVSLPAGTLQRVLQAFQDGLTGARLGFAGRYRGEVPAEASALTAAEREASRQATLQAFASLPAQLGQAFIQPWTQALEALRPTALILVPHGALHLLPLHAALLPDDTPLLERYPLAYLSSASLAHLLVGRQQAAPRPQARLVMGPPVARRSEEDLPIAQIETQELAERWGLSAVGQPYARDRMRVQVLRDHAGQLQLVHLATHSTFHHEHFLQSALQFSDERLTLFELLSDAGLNFQGTRLFYLSSCESGRAQIDAADELQGLVWTLMAAGAEAVMASLWPVDDRAARSMSSVFYREWRPGTSPVNAYQRAVQAVRKRYANPYYWAPFILCGDGFSPL